MPRWILIGLGSFCVVLTLVAIVQSARIGALRHDVEQLQTRIKSLDRNRTADPQAADLPTRTEVRELEKKIARVEQKATAGVQALVDPKPGAGLPTLIKEEDIQQLVDERIEQKLQAQSGTPQANNSGGGDRKMALSELAKELELDPQVQTQVADVANQTKKDILALLRTPRADGGSVADDLIEAYSSGDGEQIREAFGKLFTGRVPGTETSFIEGIGAIQDQARGNLKGIMGGAVYERFSHMNLKPENIQTGFDPWAEYADQRNP